MDGDSLMMYFSVIWEIVNSITTYDTWIFVPNLGITWFFTMYTDVLRWTIIRSPVQLRRLGTHSRPLLATARSSTVATGFHPLKQSALAIADGATELHVRWAVAPHPRLGQPRWAEAQKVGGFLGGVSEPLATVRPLGFSIFRGIGPRWRAEFERSSRPLITSETNIYCSPIR